ncbi:MAG: methylated-DNA--[protein]-cysteine S-methyltransferase [Alphaproteobacteria bacterium]|nr:methylated-DNA--[protein]-cysteine S-methyltransferase [Alphaproteobacteria bacterium]
MIMATMDKDMSPTSHSAPDRLAAAIRFQILESTLGLVLIAATEQGVCAILFGDDPQALEDDLRDRFPARALLDGDDALTRIATRVLDFIDAADGEADFPLDVSGTAFQQRVWQALRGVEAGSTASYKDIAERIGNPNAVRAVARACAANPVAIAIPCHRVVRSDGSLSGYRWGIERKRALLEREAGH